MRFFLKNMLYGGVVGIANIIPGLSGGTMAVVLNIYDHLIASISNLRRDFFSSVKFLLPILIGAGGALLLSSRGIDYLLTHYAMAVTFFFIGVILGSLPMIYNKAKIGGEKSKYWWGFVASMLLMILMGLFGGGKKEQASVTMTQQVDAVLLIWLFVAGVIAAICMLIPGISGSFILLLLGIYPTVIQALSEFNILWLMVMGMGILAGLFLGSKLISFLMARFPSLTYFTIMGFVVGSVPVLFFQLQQAGDLVAGFTLVTALFILLCGIGVTLAFDRIKTKK